MPSDLDRAYVINGEDLLRILTSKPMPLLAKDAAPFILDTIGKPLGGRWPITLGELELRLSKALENMTLCTADILQNGARASFERYQRAVHPDSLAAALVAAIDREGREDGDVAGVETEDDEPGAEAPAEYPDILAAASILRELNALSGTSGAGWDHAINVLRFVAGHHGYQLTEAE